MPTDTTNDTHELIRDLVARFVERPDDLTVVSQASEDGNSLYWAIRGHPKDESILVGKRGSHVDALKFLIVEFGLARGMTYTFRLVTEHDSSNKRPFQPRTAIEHNVAPDRELLIRILNRLDIPDFKVEVGPGFGQREALSFLFTIATNTAGYQKLTIPRDDDSDETLIGAIGTLWRAAGLKSGVRFSLLVGKP